jgi:hypothetical protein
VESDVSEPEWTPADMRLYHATCKYVEQIQEVFNQTLSVQEWERTVRKVYESMEFLIPRS